MNIKNLLTVKSIVTLVLTGVFSYLAISGKVTPDQFMTVFTVIIGFYFGTQKLKDYDTEERDEAYGEGNNDV